MNNLVNLVNLVINLINSVFKTALTAETWPGFPQTSKTESFTTVNVYSKHLQVINYCCKTPNLRCLRG